MLKSPALYSVTADYQDDDPGLIQSAPIYPLRGRNTRKVQPHQVRARVWSFPEHRARSDRVALLCHSQLDVRIQSTLATDHVATGTVLRVRAVERVQAYSRLTRGKQKSALSGACESSASRWVVDATASNTSPLRSTSPAGHSPPPGCPQVMRPPVSSRCVHMTPSSYSQVPQLTNAPAVFASCAKTRATRATQRHSDNDLGKAQQVQAYSQQHATLVRVPADTSSSGEQAQPEENLSV